METQIRTYQCPACNGPLGFGAKSGKMECEYCGSSFEIAQIEALYAPPVQEVQLVCPACKAELDCDTDAEQATCAKCGVEFEMEALRAYAAQKVEKKSDNMNWDIQAGNQWQEGEADGLQVYLCNTCGGEIIADATTGATQCPFCDNPVVLSKQFEGMLKPDLVIPFKVDKKAAIAALNNHYKGKRLLPKVFKNQNHIQEIKGLYVPVWLYDADVDAQVEYEATRVHRWSDSDYNYTETRHYAVIRGGAVGFENVPVDGSTKMEDALMESIEPYRISEAVPFTTMYLPGYLADKYDVDAQASIGRANERIKQSTEDAFLASVNGYGSVVAVNSNINLEHGQTKYALYPVWLLNTRWNNQKFTFAVNGQTGKIAGNLPMDKGLFWKYLLGVAGAVAAAAFAISYCMWL